MDSPLRFGVIGCGLISSFHISAIGAVPGAELAGVFDSRPETAAAVAAQHGVAHYRSMDRLLEDGSVDAVCICTPSGLHAGQALAAIAAGKHVVIEKPMALTLEDADAIAGAALDRHVKVCVISQLRFSPAMKRLRKAVDGGLFGTLVCGDSVMKFHRSQQYYDQSDWRGTWAFDGGGALMNQGIHGVDLLLYIMGPVKSVTAHARTLARSIEVEDTLAAVLEFKNGALGVIEAMVSAYPGSPRRMEITGSQGGALLEENRLLRWEVRGAAAEDFAGNEGGSGSSDPGAIDGRGHVEQIANMADAIRDGAALLVDAAEGRRALELVLAAYRSSAEGRTVYLD